MALYTPKKFMILNGKHAGKIVYELTFPDGGASDAVTAETGVNHSSVTFNPAGVFPSFTIPTRSLKEI